MVSGNPIAGAEVQHPAQSWWRLFSCKTLLQRLAGLIGHGLLLPWEKLKVFFYNTFSWRRSWLEHSYRLLVMTCQKTSLKTKWKKIEMRTKKNRMPDYALKLAGFGPRPPDVWQRQRRKATWGADVALGHPKNWENWDTLREDCLCTWQGATHFPRTPSPCGNEGSGDIHRSFVYILFTIHTYHHSSKWNRTLSIMAVTTNRGF